MRKKGSGINKDGTPRKKYDTSKRKYIIKTAEEFNRKCDEYFATLGPIYATVNGVDTVIGYKNPSFEGLAMHLGYESRQSMYDAVMRLHFPINRARSLCASYYANNLFGKSAVGAIFALKNFGWTDKTEQEINVNATVNVSISEMLRKSKEKHGEA